MWSWASIQYYVCAAVGGMCCGLTLAGSTALPPTPAAQWDGGESDG